MNEEQLVAYLSANFPDRRYPRDIIGYLSERNPEAAEKLIVIVHAAGTDAAT